MNDIEIASEAVIHCIENARSFLNSAKILIENQCYREAMLLTLYAGEEMGKVLLVINYPCYTTSDERINSWKKRFLDHTEKFLFLDQLDYLQQGFISKLFQRDDVKHKNSRLEISYIDYRDGKFLKPRAVSQEEVTSSYNDINRKLANMEKLHPNVERVKEQVVYLKELRNNI